jgi:hypothetical protein
VTNGVTQALSFTFNEKGLLKLFTGGYVIDRHMGNTGGLGGVFGIMHAIGKTLPFPDAQPVSVSMRYKFFLSLDQVARQAYTGYSKIPEDTFTLKKLYDVSSNTKEKAVEKASGYYATALEYPLNVYTLTKDKVFESGYIPKDALEKVVSTKDSVMQFASGYYTSAREYPLGVYTSAKEKVSSTKDKVIESASGYIPKDALEKVVSTKDSVMQSASGYYTTARNYPHGIYTSAKDKVSSTKDKVIESASGYLSATEYPFGIYISAKDKLSSTKDSLLSSASGYYTTASEYPRTVYTTAKDKVVSTKDSVLESATGYYTSARDSARDLSAARTKEKAFSYYTSARAYPLHVYMSAKGMVIDSASGYYSAAIETTSGAYGTTKEKAYGVYASAKEIVDSTTSGEFSPAGTGSTPSGTESTPFGTESCAARDLVTRYNAIVARTVNLGKCKHAMMSDGPEEDPFGRGSPPLGHQTSWRACACRGSPSAPQSHCTSSPGLGSPSGTEFTLSLISPPLALNPPPFGTESTPFWH